MANVSTITYQIKERARQLGFVSVGIARAGELTEEARQLEAWLAQGRHGTMDYMARNFDKRIDPTKLVEGARSVISLSYNYYTDKKQADPAAPQIAMYALGQDYHDVVRARLNELMAYIRELAGDVQGRSFVDSAPVLERAWAQRSGIGWVGKNTNLLTKRQGSYFFLAECIIDLELEYDSPVKDYCGSCTRCIDACPTEAIYEPYRVDGSKCISYFTIELKESVIPDAYSGKFANWMYGCDICQQVCPINSQATPHSTPEFEPTPALLSMTAGEWKDLTEERYKILFKHSAVKRSKYLGLMRNIRFLK